MTSHNLLPPARIVALGGPVSAALAAMRLDPHVRAVERVRELRQRIEARIAADLDLLDQLDGDADLEADHVTTERAADGSLFLMARTSDDEPSLCGVGSQELWGNLPGYPQMGGAWADNPEDIEHDDADGPEGDDERENDEAERGIADDGGVWEQFGIGRRDRVGFADHGLGA